MDYRVATEAWGVAQSVGPHAVGAQLGSQLAAGVQVSAGVQLPSKLGLAGAGRAS